MREAKISELTALTEFYESEEARKVRETQEGVGYMCKAFEDVRNEGYTRGVKQGMQQGTQQGMQQGMTRYNALMQQLFAAGRIQDAQRAVTDENYRAQLFKEFQIA